ncbi:MAG: HD domain-containing protein [Bacteroidales bacterium]
MPNKLKIFNDPVYGFINIPYALVFDIVENRYFQRLRNIKQLGLTNMVYPGANHTRFQHALGAMHLMTLSIDVLRSKGVEISDEEAESSVLAILMHDLGHGPFSHALEKVLVKDVDHEKLSLLFMEKLLPVAPEKIELSIRIFTGDYPKKFLHQLVSGQLDMDRLDYLNRDSFFSGVSEGVVSYDRIIKTLNVSNDMLVTDQKGIYSLEKFIIARRLMYWQVYLHKTVLAAEHLLINIMKRAREVYQMDENFFCTISMKKIFFDEQIQYKSFVENPHLLEYYADIDDQDIFTSIKIWMKHPDYILSDLCTRFINRRLFHIDIQKEPFEQDTIEKIRQKVCAKFHLNYEETRYHVISGITQNNAYDPGVGNIWILQKDGTVKDLAEISDQLNIRVLSNPVKKFFLSYPKEIINM